MKFIIKVNDLLLDWLHFLLKLSHQALARVEVDYTGVFVRSYYIKGPFLHMPDKSLFYISHMREIRE